MPRLQITVPSGVVIEGLLSSPVASLDAQSVDSRLSCEACLRRAEFVYGVS